MFFLAVASIAANAKESKKEGDNYHAKQILIVGLHDNVKSNYFYNGMIAEETGMKADSIDQTYNTIIAENIAASVKNGDCKFIPANATQVTGQVLNEIKVNEHILDDDKYLLIFSVEEVNRLAREGMPFRDAYKITGTLVAQCIEKGLTLETLPLEDYKAMTDLFAEDVYDAISLDTCVRERKSEGGPSPDAVKEQIALAEKALNL